MRGNRNFQRTLVVVSLVLAGKAVLALGTGNPFAGVTSGFDTIKSIGVGAGAILGGGITLIAGYRVAMKLAHSEPFVKDMMAGILAALVASLSIANW